MSKDALTILDDKNLGAFKDQALKRAHDFDVEKILPLYEKYYELIVDKSHKPIAWSLIKILGFNLQFAPDIH